MEARILNAQRQNELMTCLPKFEIPTLFNQILILKKYCPEINPFLEISLKNGQNYSGNLMNYHSPQVGLHCPTGQIQNSVVLLNEFDISTINFSWIYEFARFFSSRAKRFTTKNIGRLEFSKLLQAHHENLFKFDLKFEVILDDSWVDVSEEDFHIFEDHLSLLVTALFNLRQDNAATVSEIKKVIFQKPNGPAIAISAEKTILKITLPTESSSFFNSISDLNTQLNKTLTNI